MTMDLFSATRCSYENALINLHRSLRPILSRWLICFIILFFILAPNQILAKSRHPISDAEIREKKNQCYADIESGLWGGPCKSSMVAKENCALRCLSPTCYQLVYEGDPLEEGEKDIFRSQEYKYCMHKLSLGETLEGIKGSFNY